MKADRKNGAGGGPASSRGTILEENVARLLQSAARPVVQGRLPPALTQSDINALAAMAWPQRGNPTEDELGLAGLGPTAEPPFPAWIIPAILGGLAALGALAEWGLPGPATRSLAYEAAIMVPLVNLALGPVAALAVVVESRVSRAM